MVVFLWCGVGGNRRGGWVGGQWTRGEGYGCVGKEIACAELQNVHLVQGNGAGSECVLDSWKPNSLRNELDTN